MRPKSAPPFDPRCCENCAHFHQHYVANAAETKFSKCGTGHCTAVRRRHVRTDQTCSLFKSKSAT